MDAIDPWILSQTGGYSRLNCVRLPGTNDLFRFLGNGKQNGAIIYICKHIMTTKHGMFRAITLSTAVFATVWAERHEGVKPDIAIPENPGKPGLWNEKA